MADYNSHPESFRTDRSPSDPTSEELSAALTRRLSEKNFYTVSDPTLESFSPAVDRKVPLTVSQRVENWFLRPLRNFSSEDVFAAMMMSIPLIEKRVRYDFRVDDPEGGRKFHANSTLIQRVREIIHMSAEPEPENDVTYVWWNRFRNGLMHRGMMKGGPRFELRRDKDSGPALERIGAAIVVYPFRIALIAHSLIKASPDDMWTEGDYPFPDIYETE